jgi:hypothetical protein
VAVFSRNAGKSASFNANMIANILTPAVEMIGEGLQIAERLLTLEASNEEIERELTLVYEVDQFPPAQLQF